MSRQLTRALVAAVCAVALAACTETGTPTPTNGQSDPTSTDGAPTTTTAPGGDDHGAPKVENPLEAETQLAEPCKALTAQQQAALGIDDARPADKADFETLGPYCSWNDDKSGRVTYLVGFLTPNENGMADIYRGEKQNEWEYFEPTTVDGYPAVFADSRDRRDRGVCNLFVGIQETLVFNTQIEFAGDKACDMAQEVAGEVIKTLKSGG